MSNHPSPDLPRSSNALPRPGRLGERTRRRRGFTLIEILAVVMIMGLLMGLVGTNIFAQVQRARITTARTKMAQIENALELYKLDNSRYPTSDQGLEALLSRPSSGPEPKNYPTGGYLKRAQILDPWDAEYQYLSPGDRNQRGFDLWSLGPDQQPGGEDDDADIGNWDDATAES